MDRVTTRRPSHRMAEAFGLVDAPRP